MKKSLITVALFTALSGFAQDNQCVSTTKKGDRCLLTSWSNSLCWRHNPDYVKKEVNPTVVCSSTKKDKTNCKVKTKHPSGVCYHHRPKN